MAFDFYNKKVKSLEEIEKISEDLKAHGQRVVTINGSFDLLHVGHIYSLEKAKEFGDVLVVGLNSNTSYKLYKDKRGPLVDEKNRAITLAAMEVVDFVVLFDEPNPDRFLQAVKPHAHCTGAQYSQDCIDAKILNRIGGELHLIQELMSEELNFSTTSLITEIVNRFAKQKIRVVFLDWNVITDGNNFMEGAVEVLDYLGALGFELFVITESDSVNNNARLMEELNQIWVDRLSSNKIKIKNVYFCPHRYDEVCECRKPCFMLFQKAKKEFNIDMAKSWSIGNDLKDCQAGKLAGTKTILLGSQDIIESNSYVDYMIDDLRKIRDIIGQ